MLSLDGVTNGEVPQELHAEVAAAFDHLFRIAPDGEVAWKRAMSIAKSGGKYWKGIGDSTRQGTAEAAQGRGNPALAFIWAL